MRQEIQICGFGGQGVITAAVILGKAAAVYDQLTVTQTQSYGPEARGGAAKAEVIIADEPIGYPCVLAADILVAMSQEAFDKYHRDLKPGGIAIVDPSLVHRHAIDQPVYPVPATMIAEQLGNTVVANIVMLGGLIAIARPVSRAAVVAATLESVPARFKTLNEQAFDAGFTAGIAATSSSITK